MFFDTDPWHIATDVTVLGVIANAIRIFLAPVAKKPADEAAKISLEMERETGLVFDVFGPPKSAVHKLWPGYWTWGKNGERVRPEGNDRGAWVDPAKTVGLAAVDYFENEVPHRLEKEKESRVKDAGTPVFFNPSDSQVVTHQIRTIHPCYKCKGTVYQTGTYGWACVECGLITRDEIALRELSSAATPLPPAAAAQSAASGPVDHRLVAHGLWQISNGGRVPQEVKECPKSRTGRHGYKHDDCWCIHCGRDISDDYHHKTCRCGVPQGVDANCHRCGGKIPDGKYWDWGPDLYDHP